MDGVKIVDLDRWMHEAVASVMESVSLELDASGPVGSIDERGVWAARSNAAATRAVALAVLALAESLRPGRPEA